ncbi:MAG: AAA family ATPase [Aquificaceae bacterium]|nr:AAA family ATPase [Aquificaceae bacterium]
MNIKEIIKEASLVLRGKGDKITLSLACFLSGGHLLLEDLPGVGKTTLALTLAKVMGLSFSRIQFTSDLLPSDILGVNIFDQKRQEFVFKRGPIFSQIVLADEINRATAKTQSALLEAMAESKVSVDGFTHPLPEPFFVIATQNPLEQVGTYELPESQLDRFSMRLSIGYPDFDTEINILTGENPASQLQKLRSIATPEEIINAIKSVQSVFISKEVASIAVSIANSARRHPRLISGISTRALIHWTSCAKAMAFISGRDFVVPEDLILTLEPCLKHRLSSREDGSLDAIFTELTSEVKVGI